MKIISTLNVDNNNEIICVYKLDLIKPLSIYVCLVLVDSNLHINSDISLSLLFEAHSCTKNTVSLIDYFL